MIFNLMIFKEIIIINKMSLNYIYLLKEREFINSGEDVYKIGKTTQNNDNRFRQYPKNSILLFQSICSECSSIEKNIISKFCVEFKQRKDIGIEYFEGNFMLMINYLLDIIKEDCKYVKCFIPVNKISNNSSVTNEIVVKIIDYLRSKYTFLKREEYDKKNNGEKRKCIINRVDLYREYVDWCLKEENHNCSIMKSKFYNILSSISTLHKTTNIKCGILGIKKN
jgi:hypothetical protein